MHRRATCRAGPCYGANIDRWMDTWTAMRSADHPSATSASPRSTLSCKRQGFPTDLDCLVHAAVIHESARDTRYVRLVSQLRNSVRVYDVDWQAANTILGPKLFVPATSLEGQHAHDILPQRASLALIHHVPFACRLATTVPLRKLTCAFESTEFWGFSMCAKFGIRMCSGRPIH